MAIGNATVTTSSAEVVLKGQTDTTITVDASGATVWLAQGVPAEVGKGIKLDLYSPKHTFWGYSDKPINAIAEGASNTISIHSA